MALGACGILLIGVMLGGCSNSSAAKSEELTGDTTMSENTAVIDSENEVSETVAAGEANADTSLFAHGISEDSSAAMADTLGTDTLSTVTSDADDLGTDISAIATSDNSEASAEISTEPDRSIVERCPEDIASRRAGVTYAKAQHVTYYSTTCGLDRGVNILLPADYSTEKKYPVFYILHGIFGDENSFTGDGSNRIKEIVANMAAESRIPEPIIVFPNMYASSDPNQKPAFDAKSVEPYDNFVNDLVNDLMPYMSANYSVLTDRDNTWLAGFSMGGRETLYITLCHPELFGYVCAISPAPGLVPGKDMYMEHVGTLTEDEVKFDEAAVLPNVLMICCGTKDSVVGKFPASYHELFEKNSIEHIWYEIKNADHDNNAIKSGIYNILNQIR